MLSCRVVTLRIAATLAALLFAWSAGWSADGAAVAPGSAAPAFKAALLDGGTVTLDSLRGDPVLLNFWSPACPPCVLEMPELEKLYLRYRARGLRILGMTEMDTTPDVVRRFLSERGVTYPIALDADGAIGARYALEAHPTSILVDANGIVRYVNPGFLRGEEKDIEAAIRKVLR